MSRELRQLLAQLESKKVAAQELINKDDATQADIDNVRAEITALQSKVEAQRLIDEDSTFEAKGTPAAATGSEAEKPTAQSREYVRAFCNYTRRKMTETDHNVLNALDPGEGEDGGYIIPEDLQTKINEFKRDLPELKKLIAVEQVTVPKGRRVYEKVASMTPLTKITDLDADIASMGNPQFIPIEFSCDGYAGIMPIPNDLLDDTDQNLMNYLARWIARKSIVTTNTNILAIWNAITPVSFGDYKGIKKALNVTLDPAFFPLASVITNQDGFQYLDTLEDGTGKPILQVDVTEPSRKLFAGKPVIVLSNAVLATSGTSTKLAPFFVGAPQESAIMFERKGYGIASTKEGGTAFIKNQTHVRVIQREDVQKFDDGALIKGTIDVTAVLA